MNPQAQPPSRPPLIRRPLYDHLLILRPESKALRELEAARRALELKMRN